MLARRACRSTLLGVLVAVVAAFGQLVWEKSGGGSKLKLRRLAQHADREPDEDDKAPAAEIFDDLV